MLSMYMTLSFCSFVELLTIHLSDLSVRNNPNVDRCNPLRQNNKLFCPKHSSFSVFFRTFATEYKRLKRISLLKC